MIKKGTVGWIKGWLQWVYGVLELFLHSDGVFFWKDHIMAYCIPFYMNGDPKFWNNMQAVFLLGTPP